MFTYNFQRLVKIKFAHLQTISGPRAEWIKTHITTVYVLTALSFVTGLATGWPYLLETTGFILVMSFLSFFYVWKLPFLHKNIRSIPTSKIFVLGITWVIACGIVPFLLFADEQFEMKDGLMLLSAFLFIFSIAIPFDIRDMEVDSQSLKTIPQVLGIKIAKYLAVALLWSSAAILVYVWPHLALPFAVNALFTTLLILNSAADKNELFYSGWIDATIILQAALLYFW